jgi:hypothetical protein
MKPNNHNPKIADITQAIGYLAGYAGNKKDDDKLYPVIVWSVMRWGDGSPDEVVGQVFNGQYITEADAMADEGDVGSLIGYFTDDEEGRDYFRKAADAWREAGGPDAEDDEGDDEEDEEDDEEEDPGDDEDEWEDEEDEGDEEDIEF